MDGTMFMIYLEASVSANSSIVCKYTEVERKASNSLHCWWHYCLQRHGEEVIMVVQQRWVTTSAINMSFGIGKSYRKWQAYR